MLKDDQPQLSQNQFTYKVKDDHIRLSQTTNPPLNMKPTTTWPKSQLQSQQVFHMLS